MKKTAKENIEILSKIIHAILNDNLNNQMEVLGYEITKSTTKSKEYQLKE